MSRDSTVEKIDRQLCPGCAKLVKPAIKDTLYDQRKRPWHQSCAFRALSDHFRTSVDLEAVAGQHVSFNVPGEHARVEVRGLDFAVAVFTAPRPFLLREIEVGGDVGLNGLFVGQYSAFCCYSTADGMFCGRDLPSGVLGIGPFVVPTGMDITITFNPRTEPAPKLRLLGELVDPRRAPERGVASPACFGLSGSEAVQPGGHVECRAAPVVPTIFEHLAVDDWHGWVVERVKICCFAGDAASERVASGTAVDRPLTGRSTALPTFLVKPGEWVGLVLRNDEGAARTFAGRLRGTGNF